MSVDTWMPLYVADYLKDTRHLSTEEHGAYLLLLMTAWTNDGALPADDERLRRLTGMDAKAWKRSRGILLDFFTRAGDTWRHKRIDAELEAAAAHAERRSSKAKAAAQARWEQSPRHARGNATSNAPSMPGALLGGCPSPSPSPDISSEVGSTSSSSDARARLGGDDDDVPDPVSIAHDLCRRAGISVASPKAVATAAELVRAWQHDGATTDLMRSAIADALPKAAEPISSLRYFDKPIRHRIALEANGHDPALNGARQPRRFEDGQRRGGAAALLGIDGST